MKRKLNEHDVPEPVVTGFGAFDLDERLLQSIASERFEKPTAVQIKTIPLIQQGKNAAIRAKTGSGKTVAYLLPILNSILRLNLKITTTSAIILVPSKELASQITSVLQRLCKAFSKTVTFANITKEETENVTRSKLRTKPSIVIATPSRFNHFLDGDIHLLADLKYLVIDEADLVISYGHEDDLRSIAAALSTSVQTIFVSATLRTDAAILTKVFEKSGSTDVVDLSEQEQNESGKLEQFVVATAEDEKFLLLYAIFKLQLIKGKIIIFVADVDRCYRLKLFLEQFGVRSCVLNSELPVNSRLHVVEEFNKGVYDTLIAADDNEVVGDHNTSKKAQEGQDDNGVEGAEDAMLNRKLDDDVDMESEAEAEEAPNKKNVKSRKSGNKANKNQDREFGVSRGIDFRRVTCVLNFDLPQSSKSYTHRVGRTARAGEKGMALSFFVPTALYRKHKPTSIPQCASDEKILNRIRRKQEEAGASLEEWQFDMDKLAGFKYRLADALRAVTRIAVREARTKELRQELINSTKLQRHFEEHPEDLRHLRHDTESHSVRHQAHLKHVPDYLLPNGGKAALKKDVGFLGPKSGSDNRLRKARAFNKSKGKGRLARSKGLDPLKSFNTQGRGRK